MSATSDAALRAEFFQLLGFTDDGTLTNAFVKALVENYNTWSIFLGEYNLLVQQGKIVVGAPGAGLVSFQGRGAVAATLTLADVQGVGLQYSDVNADIAGAAATALSSAMSNAAANYLLKTIIPVPAGVADEGKVITVDSVNGTTYVLAVPTGGGGSGGIGVLTPTTAGSSRNAVLADVTAGGIDASALSVPIVITLPNDGSWDTTPPNNSLLALYNKGVAQCSFAFGTSITAVGIGPAKCAQQGAWLFARKLGTNSWNYFGQNASS